MSVRRNKLQSLLVGKRLLIFDFDGTVADTVALHTEAFTRVLSPMGIALNYPAISGLKTSDAIRKCFADASRVLSDEELLELVLVKQRTVRHLISRNLYALPGVDEFLRWARPQFLLAMCTSGSRGTVELALWTLGYFGWFEPLVCADDVLNAKPDPEGFLKVLGITGIRAADTLVFEDSIPGFKAAQAAGLELVDARRNIWQQLDLHGQVT
jgi:beta-phosphoglucomutase